MPGPFHAMTEAVAGARLHLWREADCMADESLDVRMARIEEAINVVRAAIVDGRMVERLICLEQQMSVIKWIGGAGWALTLVLVGVLAKELIK